MTYRLSTYTFKIKIVLESHKNLEKVKKIVEKIKKILLFQEFFSHFF